jgi:catechol 2,3-dioxygenase-like lactoylglutathione lyase family enzyme
MRLSSHYSVLCTHHVIESRDFYARHFGFRVGVDLGWYVSLYLPDQQHYHLAIFEYDHPTMPEPFRKPVQGLILHFEVEDVDAEHERLQAAGVPIQVALREEEWGHRHFMISDPSGVLIDVIKVIPPSREFMRAHRESLKLQSA